MSRHPAPGVARPTWVALAVAVLAAPAAAQQPPEGNGAKPPPGPTLSLGECIAIGLDNRPSVKAARRSLAATELGIRSIAGLPNFASLVSPDLPVRREQSKRGIIAVQADLRKAEDEVRYDVTRLYYSYVYARQQEQTATGVIEQLETQAQVVKEILETGAVPPGGAQINRFTLYALEQGIDEVRLLLLQAQTGQKAALEALKEAMGADPCPEFTPRDPELPLMGGATTKAQVIDLALGRRPEIAQAAAGVDAWRLEVQAQQKVRGFQANTLALGSDLHSRPVPLANRNGEYKPGAVAPEMPVSLVGRKEDRVARAVELSHRQDAVYESGAVNLIRLEAANAFINWEATTRRVELTKKRFETARKQVEDARAAAAARPDPKNVLESEALAGRAQAQYVEAVFEHLKALATLERVTSGGILPAFPGR